MTRERTDRIAEEVLRRIRGEVLGRAERSYAEIDRIYQRVAAQIREEIRGVASAATIERIARERLEDALGDVLGVVEPQIQAAAVAAAVTPAEQFRALFPRQAAPAIAAELQAQRAAAETLRGRLVVDRVPISARLRTRHREVAREIARETQAALRAGASMHDTAERILAADTRATEIPLYVRQMEQAARRGGDAFRREATRYRRYVSGLGSSDRGQTSIRAATETLIQRLEGASDAQIDRVVQRWVADKAQYQARVIARTETVRAHRESYIASTRSQPYVKGYRWSLSPSGRHRPDVCDVLAGQDLYGLGPGGYPVDQVPDIPHPSDLCTQTAIIDEHHFDRELARETGDAEPPRTWESGRRETPEQWLRDQPAALRREILGPTRDRILREGSGRVVTPTGSIRRVRDILGDARRAAG